MANFKTDQLTDAGVRYLYVNGTWTTKGGMCLSTTEAYRLTMKFYERHGRSPVSTTEAELAKVSRASKAQRVKTLKMALAKALAAKAANVATK